MEGGNISLIVEKSGTSAKCFLKSYFAHLQSIIAHFYLLMTISKMEILFSWAFGYGGGGATDRCCWLTGRWRLSSSRLWPPCRCCWSLSSSRWRLSTTCWNSAICTTVLVSSIMPLGLVSSVMPLGFVSRNMLLVLVSRIMPLVVVSRTTPLSQPDVYQQKKMVFQKKVWISEWPEWPF